MGESIQTEKGLMIGWGWGGGRLWQGGEPALG